MRRIAIAFLAVLILAAADDKADSKKDLEKMQGDWAVRSLTRDGMKFPDDDAQCIFRTVKGEEFATYRYEKPAGKGKYVLDATKTPRAIDIYPAGVTDEAKALKGIYEFEGDGYRICFAPPGKPRPTEFASKQGSGHTLTVWRPEKK